MPRPFASTLVLTSEQAQTLDTLIRAGSTPQSIALRCRIVRMAAVPHPPSNWQIAEALGCDRHTVGTWRERFFSQGFSGLHDAPRSGRPRSFSPR